MDKKMMAGIDYIVETCSTLTLEELLALTKYKQTGVEMLGKTSEKEFKQFKRKHKKQLTAISSALSTSGKEQHTLEYVIFQFKTELSMLTYDQKIGSAYCGGYFDAVYFMVQAILSKAISKNEVAVFSDSTGWDEVNKLLYLIRSNYDKEIK